MYLSVSTQFDYPIMSAVSTISILTPETFNFANITLGSANKFDEYGFTKYRVGYKREDTTDDVCMIKITNLTVTGVYEPRADNDGNPPKNPKYTVTLTCSSSPLALQQRMHRVKTNGDLA